MKNIALILVAVCLIVIYNHQQHINITNHALHSAHATLVKPTQCLTKLAQPFGDFATRQNKHVVSTAQDLSLNHTKPLRLIFSSAVETRNNSLKELTFVVKSSRPQPFNDSWAKMNTVDKVHQAATKDGKLDYVLKISEKMHLPPSVAIVPIVESNYRNHIVSHKGAAGTWQLMPQTARDYGINLKERFQLRASTGAALHLLKDLHEKFDNWELAYAAYNAGGNRVWHALKKNPKAKSINELDLPRETKQYVSRLKRINLLIMRFADVRSDLSHMIADL